MVKENKNRYQKIDENIHDIHPRIDRIV